MTVTEAELLCLHGDVREANLLVPALNILFVCRFRVRWDEPISPSLERFRTFNDSRTRNTNVAFVQSKAFYNSRLYFNR
ncbi:hypothetical protein Hanom_Chr17g01559761 [Helianthus anomalus]